MSRPPSRTPVALLSLHQPQQPAVDGRVDLGLDVLDAALDLGGRILGPDRRDPGDEYEHGHGDEARHGCSRMSTT